MADSCDSCDNSTDGDKLLGSYGNIIERIVEQADGLCAAETVLTMAGAWQADADVSLPGQDARFTFFFATR
jgi:hypothetical protein